MGFPIDNGRGALLTFRGREVDGELVQETSSPTSTTIVKNVLAVTAAVLLRPANAERLYLLVQPVGGDIYLGEDNTLTTANGVPKVIDGATFIEDAFLGAVWVVAASGSVSVRWREVG